MSSDVEDLRTWIGKTETKHDVATLAPLQALSATLDRTDPFPCLGDAVPPCAHWLYFLPLAAMSSVGPDGHPRRGDFLPPISLPRRMWAGSRIAFARAIEAGEALVRTSRIADLIAKEGRSGSLMFVRVSHEISDARSTTVITEEQDVVYRGMPVPGEVGPPARAARSDEQFRR